MNRSVVTGLVGLGIGISVTLAFTKAGSGRADADRKARDADGGTRRAVTELAHLEDRLRQKEVSEKELRATVDELTRKLRAYENAEGAGGARRTEKKGPKLKGPRFVFPETHKTLDKLDWDALGGATAKLMPVLSEANDVAYGRKEMRPDLWGDIMKHVGPLVTEAIKLETEGVGWENPSFLANYVHATLAKAGQPLGEQQEEALQRIGLRYVDEDTRRKAAYGESTLALTKMIDSCKLQDRFFVEVRGLLNGEQKAVLYPPGVEGVIGLDIFSGATTWEESVDRVNHKGRESLRVAMADRHQKELKLRPEAQAVLATLAGEWAAALPDAYINVVPDAPSLQNSDMEKSARVLFAAERQAKLFRDLLTRAPLNEAERERVLDHAEVYVPLLTGK